jgi:hypothetical protein
MAQRKPKGTRYVTDPYPPAPLPNIGDEASNDLKDLAVKHGNFEDFQKAMVSHGETAWDNDTDQPVALDGLSDTTSGQLYDLANQHNRKESFLQEVQRIAERIWGQVKNRGHAPAGHAAGATHEPSKKYPHAG